MDMVVLYRLAFLDLGKYLAGRNLFQVIGLLCHVASSLDAALAFNDASLDIWDKLQEYQVSQRAKESACVALQLRLLNSYIRLRRRPFDPGSF